MTVNANRPETARRISFQMSAVFSTARATADDGRARRPVSLHRRHNPTGGMRATTTSSSSRTTIRSIPRGLRRGAPLRGAIPRSPGRRRCDGVRRTRRRTRARTARRRSGSANRRVAPPGPNGRAAGAGARDLQSAATERRHRPGREAGPRRRATRRVRPGREGDRRECRGSPQTRTRCTCR